MSITSITTFHRKVIKDLRGPPHVITPFGGNDGTVYFRFVGEDIEQKNPLAKPRYPGVSLRIWAPRRNLDWASPENYNWRQPNPSNPAETLAFSAPQTTQWLDYRVSVFAKNQPQFDALCQLMWSIWDLGRDQFGLSVQDEDEPTLIHRVQMRLIMQTNRFRPEDNVFIADYLITVPISILLKKPQGQQSITQFQLNLDAVLDPDLIPTP